MTFQNASVGRDEGSCDASTLLRRLEMQVERPLVWLSGVAFSLGVWILLIVTVTHIR